MGETIVEMGAEVASNRSGERRVVDVVPAMEGVDALWFGFI